MECFSHPGSQAVALCKVCARGVCRACAVPVTNGFACSTEHAPLAERMALVQTVSARNIGLYSAQRWVQPIAGAGLAVLGATFAYSYPSQSLGWIFLLMGCAVSGLALFGAFRKR